jgi:hypothetical protein
VQTYKNGPHSAESQKLLNEIAAAKLCLLRPAKRAAYDTDLRERLATKQSVSVPMHAPVAPVSPVSVPTAPALVGAGARPSPLPPPPITAPPPLHDDDHQSHRPAIGATAILAAGSILILLLVIAIVAVLRNGFGSQGSPGKDQPPGGATTDTTNAGANKTGEAAVLPDVASTQNPFEQPSVPKNGGTNDSKPQSDHPNDTPAMATTKSTETPKPADATGKPPDKPSPAETPTPKVATPSPPTKLLVPDEAAKTAAEARLQAEFAGIDPEGMLEKSKALNEGPLAYVVLQKALEAAELKGDVALVGHIADDLCRRFTVDQVPLRANALLEVRKHVVSSAAWESLAVMALPLVDEAVAANRPDLSAPLAEASLVAARKSGNIELIRKVTLRVLLLQEQGPGK